MQNLQKKISSKSPYSKCDDFMINNDQSQPQTHRGTLGAFSGGQACGISYISNAPAGPANIFPHTFWNFIAFVAYLLEIHTFGVHLLEFHTFCCVPSRISQILWRSAHAEFPRKFFRKVFIPNVTILLMKISKVSPRRIGVLSEHFREGEHVESHTF